MGSARLARRAPAHLTAPLPPVQCKAGTGRLAPNTKACKTCSAKHCNNCDENYKTCKAVSGSCSSCASSNRHATATATAAVAAPPVTT